MAAAGLASIFIGTLGQVPWDRFFSLVSSESSVAAIRLSLMTAGLATVISLILGVPLAVLLARSRSRFVPLLRALVLVPMVLPPVVAGVALIATFGRKGLLGPTLQSLGIEVAFTTTAVVMAQTFVAMPFLVISLEGALRGGHDRFEEVAATLGASPTYVLRRITLPLVLPAIGAGSALTFARALGEFGATLTFAGSLQGTTRTLPLEIYLQRETDQDAAIALSVLLIVLAAVIAAIALRSPAKGTV